MVRGFYFDLSNHVTAVHLYCECTGVKVARNSQLGGCGGLIVLAVCQGIVLDLKHTFIWSYTAKMKVITILKKKMAMNLERR